MRGDSSVVHNVGVLAIGQIGAQILNVVALIFLARYLGSHWFGVVQIGVAFSAYALIVAEWGMMSLGIREVSRLDETPAVLRYARTHLGMLTVQALAVLVIGLLVLPLFPFYVQDRLVFWLYLATVVPQVFMQDWIGIGLERMRWVGIAKTSRSLCYAVLVLLALKPLVGLGWLAAQRWVPVIFLISFFGSNLTIAIPVTRWLGQAVRPRYGEPAEWRRRWSLAAPIGASIVMLRILLNIDIILLGVLATPAVAGAYAAAARIIFLLVVAMEVLWKALLPRLSRLAKTSPAAFRRSFNQYLGLVLAGLLPVAVGGYAVGPELIDLLYSGRLPEAGRVFQVLAVSYTLLSVGWFFGNSLVAMDRQREYFPPLLVCAAVAVVGCVTLVPRLGGIGASWGMFGAHALLVTVLGLTCRRLFSRRLWGALSVIVPALLVLLLVLRLTAGWPVPARIVAGGASYLALAGYPLLRWSRGGADTA